MEGRRLSLPERLPKLCLILVIGSQISSSTLKKSTTKTINFNTGSNKTKPPISTFTTMDLHLDAKILHLKIKEGFGKLGSVFTIKV